MATRLIAFSLLTALAAAQLPGLTGLPTSVAPGLPGFGLPGIQGTNVNQKDRIVAITGNVAAVMTSLGTSIVAPNIDMPVSFLLKTLQRSSDQEHHLRSHYFAQKSS